MLAFFLFSGILTRDTSRTVCPISLAASACVLHAVLSILYGTLLQLLVLLCWTPLECQLRRCRDSPQPATLALKQALYVADVLTIYTAATRSQASAG